MSKPKIASPVRWYSTVNMIDNLLLMRDVIMQDIMPILTPDKAELITTFDWDCITEIVEALKPLNHCIGALEKEDVSLGEAFREILLYMKQLFTQSKVTPMIMSMRKSFLYYFSPSKIDTNELGLYIGSYLLDPRVIGLIS